MNDVKTRYYGLDFARAIFILLGLFYHASLIYSEGSNWRVVSEVSVPLLSVVGYFTKSFRMEAFYVLAGFFFALLIVSERKNLLKERIVFLLVPMFVVGFTFNSLMNYYSFNREYVFDINYYIYGDWIGHLWFLGNLAVYYILSFNLIKFFVKKSFLVNGPIFYFTIFSTSFFATALKVISPDFVFLFITFKSLLYYFPYFFLGAFLFKVRDLFFNFISIRRSLFMLLIFCVAKFFSFILLPEKIVLGVDHLLRIFAVFSVVGVLNFIGNYSSNVVKDLVQSSYTVYLFHQPIIVLVFCFFFIDLELGSLLSYFLIVLISFFLPFIFHKYCVSKVSFLRFIFNGRIY